MKQQLYVNIFLELQLKHEHTWKNQTTIFFRSLYPYQWIHSKTKSTFPDKDTFFLKELMLRSNKSLHTW